jgi:hypothetical protein
MRESKKGEKTHLPRDSTEIWLDKQKAPPGEAKHKHPPEDTYEAWVEKRSEKGGRAVTKGKK